MPIRFRCKCGKGLKVADSFAGKRAKCPKCGIVLVVPRKTVKPAAEPKSAPPPPPSPKTPPPPEPRADIPISASELELEVEPPPPPIDVKRDFGLAPEEPVAPREEPDAGVPLDLGVGPSATEVPGAVVEEALPAAEVVQEAAPSERSCPKCGAPLAPDAVICVDCGTSVKTEAPPPAAPQLAAIGGKKAWLGMLLIPVVLAVLIGAVYGLASLTGGKKAPPALPTEAGPATTAEPSAESPEQPVRKPPATTPSGIPSPGPRPRPEPRPQPESAAKPAPLPPTHWPGFSDQSLVVRDKLLEIDQRLAAFQKRNNRPAASLAEAGLPADQAENFTYVKPTPESRGRVLPVAYQARTDTSDRSYVLFSDRTVRPLTAEELAAALPKPTASGWLTDADLALLKQLAPVLRVTNRRFRVLDVRVDGKSLGQVEQGASRSFRLAPGTHTLVFSAGDAQTKPINGSFSAGAIHEYAFPLYQELPPIPLRAYRAALTGKTSVYERDTEDPNTTVLAGEDETIRFPKETGRPAIAADWRSTTATIERRGFKIQGLKARPMLVSAIGCLEEGVVRYDHGDEEIYRRTALDTLRIRERANTVAAPLALLPAIATQPRQRETEDRASKRRRRPARRSRRRRDQERITPSGPPPKFAFPTPQHRTVPDCEALEKPFRTTASGTVPLLINQAKLLGMKPEAGFDRAFQTAAPGRVPPPINEADLSRMKPEAAKEGAGPEISPAALLATLALYGDSSAVNPLSVLHAKLPAGAAGYGELLLALARCGGGSALLPIRSAADATPIASAIALAMIDDSAARKALGEVVSDWPPKDIEIAVKAWPDLAGPHSRRAFVETFALARAEKLDDVATLNALLKMEPYALEQVLAKRFAARQRQLAGTAMQGEAAPNGWRVLGHFRNTGAVKHFCTLLRSTDPAMKRHALLALGATGDGAFVPHITPLLRDPSGNVRAAAVAALVGIGDAAAVQALSEAMKPDLVLASIPEATPVLARRAGRQATAELLTKMLNVALKERKTPEEAAAGGGARRRRPTGQSRRGARGAQQDEEIVEGTEKATPQMLLEAIALAAADTEAVQAAIKQGRSHADPAVRAASYKARAATTARRGGSLLRGLIKLSPLRLLPQASRHVQQPASLAAVCAEAIKDPDPVVRVAGVRLLRGATAASAVFALEAALHDHSPDVRVAIMEVLPELTGTDPRVTPLIAAGLIDSDARVVATAARLAIMRKDPALGPAVVQGLSRPHADTSDDPKRIDAILALTRAAAVLREKNAARALGLVLGHDSVKVRIEAARALGTISDERALPGLLKAAKDDDSEVVAAVFAALCAFDPDKLSLDIRILALTHLAAGRTQAGTERKSATTRRGLAEDKSLAALAQLASTAPPEWHPALAVLGKRYLAGADDKKMSAAAEILSYVADDASVHHLLFEALEESPTKLGTPVANLLRRTRDPALLDGLWEKYKALDKALRDEEAAQRKADRDHKQDSRRTSLLQRSRPARTSRGKKSEPKGLAKVGEADQVLLRSAIVEALGHIGGDPAAIILNRIARLEDREEVLRKTVEALASTNAPKAVSSLGRMARRSDAVGIEAARALALMGRLSPDQARNDFRRLKRSFTPQVAAAAADGLNALNAE